MINLLLKCMILFYYMIGLTQSKTISFDRNEEPLSINFQEGSNDKLNWLLQTCITDAEEVLMGLNQEVQMRGHEQVAEDQLFLLINCDSMGSFLSKLKDYHQQLIEFPVTKSTNDILSMNKWVKKTERSIRKHLNRLQSDCAPSLDLQEIMDNLLDCILKTGYSMERTDEATHTDGSLGQDQRIKRLLEALKSRRATTQKKEQPPIMQNQYEKVGEIDLNLDSHMREVPPTFLSVALGSRLIQNGWEQFNTSSPLLRALVSAISPAILRMGGTSANYLTYDPELTTTKNFHNCQDIDGLQLEDLDPFNFEDMYDNNIEGNSLNIESTNRDKQRLSNGNLLINENQFKDYYYDNININDDLLVRPDVDNFDNFLTDPEIRNQRFENSDSSELSNDPFNTLRDALSNSNRNQENHGPSNMDASSNIAQLSNKVIAKKSDAMNAFSNIFGVRQSNKINHVSFNHENRIASNLYPFQRKKKVHNVDSEPTNLHNMKILLQNRNRRYWSHDQYVEERIPGYQLRRFRRNVDSSHQYPLTEFLNRRSIHSSDISSASRDDSINDKHNGIHSLFDPDISNIMKSGMDLKSSPNIVTAISKENQQNIYERSRMNHATNPLHQYYSHGVKHLYKEKQSNNQESQNEHDWVYHHGMIHSHDLREHLENNDSSTDSVDIRSKISEHNDQHNSITNYDDKGCSCEYLRTGFTNFTMTGDDLSSLLEFVEAVNLTLLWDMNHLYRKADGGWDPTNARMIMQEVSRKNTDVIWQLGNEPNSYYHHTGFSLTGREEALDYGAFRRELLAVFPEVTIVGPDTTRPRFHGNRISDAAGFRTDSVKFMREFLTYGSEYIDVVSWHQYYLDGHNCTMEDFMDPILMDVLIKQIDTMVALRDELAPNKPMWITETASAYGGGAPDLSNRYVAGFLWLDKLGLSARMGVDLVARQTLYHGCYALLDSHLQPYPDYWLSVIYKQQVGGRVLDMQLSTSTPNVRLYAHCLNPTSQHYKQDGVVVYGMNLGDKGASVSLHGPLNETQVLEMILQPPEEELQSSSVMLNGVVIELTSEESLPSLNAHPSNILGALQIPSQSMGFWLLPDAKAQACH